MKRFLLLFLASVSPLLGQSNTGELRLKVTDPSGLGTKSSVELVCEADQFQETFETDDAGNLVAKRLPFGVYRLRVGHSGFATFTDSVQIRSATPLAFTAKLSLAAANETVVVKDSDTLIDPYRTGTINRIGTDTIETRVESLPGRSLQDLVNSQPGWLY
jgi:hypothetical protein